MDNTIGNPVNDEQNAVDAANRHIEAAANPIPDRKQEYGVMGAIIGDVCGSIYEFRNRKTDAPKSIALFRADCDITDDSIMTVATMAACLDNGWVDGNFSRRCGEKYLKYGRKYPHPMGGYGGRFGQWLADGTMGPYNSWGNGSAMRASPVGWLRDAGCDNMEKVLELAKATAIPTHNHPEGVKGAQAVAAAVWLARETENKAEVKSYIESTFGYDLSRKTDDIRPTYDFDESCQGTVPVALVAFLESEDFTHAIQLAISVGGDTDTLACITGAVAGAHYRDVPEDLLRFVCRKARELAPQIQRFVKQAGVNADLARFFDTRNRQSSEDIGVC